MRPILAGVAAFLVAQSAFCAESFVLRHESTEGVWDFDVASIVIVNDTLRRSESVLTLKRPLQDQPTGSVYDRVIFSYEHDCKGNRIRVVGSQSFLKGEPVKTARPNDAWRPGGESAAQKYACALVEK